MSSTLTVQSTALTRPSDGRFFGVNGGVDPANTTYGFGGYYLLTTKEGIQDKIDASTGDLSVSSRSPKPDCVEPH